VRNIFSPAYRCLEIAVNETKTLTLSKLCYRPKRLGDRPMACLTPLVTSVTSNFLSLTTSRKRRARYPQFSPRRCSLRDVSRPFPYAPNSACGCASPHNANPAWWHRAHRVKAVRRSRGRPAAPWRGWSYFFLNAILSYGAHGLKYFLPGIQMSRDTHERNKDTHLEQVILSAETVG
jgi:hypothetical protein